MSARILLYLCHMVLKTLDKAESQLTNLWIKASNSDRAEIRDLSDALSQINLKEQEEAVLEAQEVIQDVYEKAGRC